jgi:hypothetical protein
MRVVVAILVVPLLVIIVVVMATLFMAWIFIVARRRSTWSWMSRSCRAILAHALNKLIKLSPIKPYTTAGRTIIDLDTLAIANN